MEINIRQIANSIDLYVSVYVLRVMGCVFVLTFCLWSTLFTDQVPQHIETKSLSALHSTQYNLFFASGLQMYIYILYIVLIYVYLYMSLLLKNARVG